MRFSYFFEEMLARFEKKTYLCTRKNEKGAIAQLVEQRTENPCVPGSIPGGTTINRLSTEREMSVFCFASAKIRLFPKLCKHFTEKMGEIQNFLVVRRFFRLSIFKYQLNVVPLHRFSNHSDSSAVGSALRSGRRGRAFESPLSDLI